METCYELFYRKGYYRIGVDEIAEATGLTKRSLYYHFKSKDELLTEVMEFYQTLALERVRHYGEKYDGSLAQVIDALFSDLRRWVSKPGYSGAGFTRIAMELADLPGHPAHAVARRHKKTLESWWVELLAKRGISSPAERARQLVLLLEGAAALTLIHRDRSYLESAANAAKTLIALNIDSRR